MISASRLAWSDSLVLIAGYLALDWMSFFHPLHGHFITPWNPAPALALVFILRFGCVAVLPLSAAVLLNEVWVHSLAAALLPSLAITVIIALGYGAVGEILRRQIPGVGIFTDRVGLLRWAATIAIGTLLTSVTFVLALVALDLLPLSSLRPAVGRYWIADGVGIIVSMPLLWMLFDERGRALLRATLRQTATLGYVLAAAAALWLAVGHGEQSDVQYFYLLFLPIIWAAARQGLAGAVFSAAVIQIGLIAVFYLQGFSATSIVEIQAVTVVLVLAGFFIGAVVDEQQRISAELRQTLRLAAAGEMAGALAHELNQPLTALSAYGAACDELLARGETGERLKETIRLMVSESYRAAEVVRRLRDFFRTGTTRLEPIPLQRLLAVAAAPFAKRASKCGVRLSIGPVPEGVLMADRPQIEVVLRNLLSNAFDAVSEQASGERRVRVSALREGGDRICIRVEDSGPGLTGEAVTRLFEPFNSTKSSGLGLGLAISRAIAEAHGGNLWAEVGACGVFRLLLPFEETAAHA